MQLAQAVENLMMTGHVDGSPRAGEAVQQRVQLQTSLLARSEHLRMHRHVPSRPRK